MGKGVLDMGEHLGPSGVDLLAMVFGLGAIVVCGILILFCVGALLAIVVGSYLGLQRLLGDMAEVASLVDGSLEYGLQCLGLIFVTRL